MEYRKSELPCLLQWQNLQAGNYVVGIEPVTVWPEGDREAQKARGEVRWLDPGDHCDYTLTFSALAGQSSLDALVDRVSA